jgi:hypothetical protein
MKKTDRKNKTNLTVTWPSNIFTIKELNVLNPDFVEITLRVRIKKAIESSEITDIGVLHNGKGRPTLVFVHGTPTKEHLEEAKSRQVILKDSTTVNVVNINSKKQIVSIFDDAKTTKSVIEMSENKPVNV